MTDLTDKRARFRLEREVIALSDTLSIPLLDYAMQGNAILGIRDSGKSYTGTLFAERLMEAGIPIIAFDPIGVWRYLKVPGPGVNGKGYPIVVAGQKGDIDLTPQSTEAFITAAIAENVSVVIDLDSMPHLSEADKRLMVETTVRVLLQKNDSLRHLFLEEAAQFCPQDLLPEYKRVYVAIEKFARLSGNKHLGYTLINQRAEQVNKAVLENCDCLFLHRQKGKNSLGSFRKWLDLTEISQAREIVSSLPALPTGECWVWLQEAVAPVRVRIPKKRAFHPDRRSPRAKLQIPLPSVAADVAPFVHRMKQHLESLAIAPPSAALPGGIPASQAALFQNKIALLENELRTLRSKPPREIPILSDDHMRSLRETAQTASEIGRQLAEVSSAIVSELAKARKPQPLKAAPEIKPAPPPALIASKVEGSVGGGIRRMMIALAQRPGLNKRQLGLRAGLSSKSGTFRNYLSVLRKNQWIDESVADQISLSPAGTHELGSFDPLPTGQALLQYWITQLGAGPGRILRCLADVYPTALDKTQLGEMCGLANSGTFRNYLSELRGFELMTSRGDSLQASAELFD